MKSNNIPVILSSDDNYAPYLCVTAFSIMKNSKQDDFYDFYLLLAPDFSEKNKNKISKSLKKFKNCKLNFVDMGDAFSNLEQKIAHITNPTYYRLKAVEILPKEYDKCIYLDTDVIVKSDLREYFDIDLKNNYVAGVIAAGYLLNSSSTKSYAQYLKLDSLDTYINAGAILINLKKWRDENITPTLCKLAENNYRTVDQDVINTAFYKNILVLEPKYNLMTKYDFFKPSEKLIKIYTNEAIKKALDETKIIHYADKIKPWNNFKSFFFLDWWYYALKTPYKFSLIKNFVFLKNYIRNLFKNDICKMRILFKICMG